MAEITIKELLNPTHQAIKETARAFKLTYSEAALLLLEYHINDMHFTANLYKDTLPKK